MKKKLIVITGIMLIALSANIFAGSTYQSYSTTVGAFNGSGYTAYQSKVIGSDDADLDSTSVGGDYVVDARMVRDDGYVGAWTRNVDDNTLTTLASNLVYETYDSVRVQFSNDLTTTVSVQVSGSWRSN